MCCFNITITGPEDSPYNITVETGSAFALYIEWAPPPTPNGIITRYSIYATYDNGSAAILSVNSSINSYSLNALFPDQTVYISLSASTVAGEGPLSDQMAYRTSEAGKMQRMGMHNSYLIYTFV